MTALTRVVRVIEYVGTPEDVQRQLEGSLNDGVAQPNPTIRITITTVKTSAEAVAAFGGARKDN